MNIHIGIIVMEPWSLGIIRDICPCI